MISQDPLRDFEGKPASRQMWERVDRVRPIRIHQPGGLRRLWWYSVVVDDANKNPCLECLSDTGAVSGTAVDCEDQFNAIFECSGDCPLRDAVTIAVALRDVALGNCADSAKCSNHDRRSSEPVGIKVANHKDGLPLFTGGA